MFKDWWTGKATLTSSLLLLILGGWLFWVVSGLAIIDFVRSPHFQTMSLVVMALRLLFLAFASVAVWRSAGHAKPPGKVIGRLLVVLVAVWFLGICAAMMLPMLSRP